MTIFIYHKIPLDVNDKSQIHPYYNITIKVLNGIGIPGLARNVRNDLISKGLNVLSFDNAKRFCYLKSVIIIKKMNLNKLKFITKIIPIPYIYSQINQESTYDFIIIVGKDYGKYFKKID